MTPTGNEGSEDLMVSEVLGDSDEEAREDSTSEILISAILWAVFLAGDSADDLGEKAIKAEKTSKSA